MIQDCILCKKQFETHRNAKPFKCTICYLSPEALYELYVDRHLRKMARLDYSDVCYDCDEKILEQHNSEIHHSVDLA